MSDSGERMLLDERHEQPTARSSNSEEVSNADLFSLLKTNMNDKIGGIEKTFSDTTQSLAKKVRKTENSFKFKGNQLQFELNSDLIEDINSAIRFMDSNKQPKAVAILNKSLDILKKRNKHIRIADKPDGGWKTVEEYLSDEVASDSEDEKRIRAAENRAVRKLKAGKKSDKVIFRKRPAEAAGAPSQSVHNDGNYSAVPPFRAAGTAASAQQNFKANDQGFRCSSFGHWARECRNKLDGEKARFPRGPVV